MMSTDWTDIRSDIRDELEEEIAAVYNDDILLTWWNEGASDFSRRSKCLYDEQYTNCVAGQQSYTLPNKTLEVLQANYKTYALVRTEYPEFSQLTGSGTPNTYAVWDEAIYLYPIPSTSATGVVYVQRLYEPSPITATQSTDFSVRDIMNVKSYIKMRAYEMSGDLEMANWHRNSYETYLTERRMEAMRLRNSGRAIEPGIVW